ncbi:MAG: hypothetical protein GXY48_01865 [Methanomicrobiales archaeon]|nr:hypothetical protein [Methanomicrobiales archaeon]
MKTSGTSHPEWVWYEVEDWVFAPSAMRKCPHPPHTRNMMTSTSNQSVATGCNC